MDILKHLKKLEDRIESLFEADGTVRKDAPDTAPPAAAPETSGPSGQVAPSGPSTPATAPAAAPKPRRREPLELKKDILSRIEAEIRRIDGRPAFPFNRIDVLLWADDAHHQAILEAELIDSDRLRRDVVRTLEAARATPDRRLIVAAKFTSTLDDRAKPLLARGFTVECTREQETEKMTRGGQARARLQVVQGEAETAMLAIEKARVYIGRLTEVVDQAGRVVRRNDLAFKDVPGVNGTVSRLHAHIRFDKEADEFRLFDDNSADGTTVFRDGRRIDVPQGQRRGVVLQDGDEIYFGQAHVRFEHG